MRVASASIQAKHVFRWDLDKTYLKTEFDTVRDLLKSALEKAREKRAVPGAPAILKALRAAGGASHRICIVSGSPRQMRRVLEAKLALDGVEFDEFILKPNLTNLLRGRFRAMRQQIPYKLPALLASRLNSPQARETLFGDDAESDALIYSLYADIVAGRVGRREAESVLRAAEAYDDQRAETLDLLDLVPKQDAVVRILIHLDRRTPTARFDRFGPRLVPIFNYFQAALVLYGDGQLSASDVVGVAREMLASGDYEVSSLANSLQDLMRRGRIARDTAARLALEAQSAVDVHASSWPDLPPKDEIAWAFATRVRSLGDHAVAPPPVEPGGLDYAALTWEDNARRKTCVRRGEPML
ncbi:MAG: hypothetical protein HY698_13185 [Deltaproteobacteria bacterium]|nr:hypothetical protein [Deltaproteobacteria bacterium]